MYVQFELQPTIYKLKEGDTLRLVLYTTDFEITIRDNTAYQLTVDLEQSSLILPCQKVWYQTFNMEDFHLNSLTKQKLGIKFNSV